MFERAAKAVRESKRTVAFTGAGISVESGIPPFRGVDGIWSKYDPQCLDIGYFLSHPEPSWKVIKEIFYDFFGAAKPNAAHTGLARMEQSGLLHSVITQNIDNLHQLAGSKTVREFHGNSQVLVCLSCSKRYPAAEVNLLTMPPKCESCGGLLKPDFVFFGEPIPEPTRTKSFEDAETADVLIAVGTTGEVMPAAMIPLIAKQHGASIIEINTESSSFTEQTTDIFLQGKATTAMTALLEALDLALPESGDPA